LFLYDVASQEYEQLVCRHAGSQLVEAEQRMFGVGHEEIGLKSAHSWGLPENIKVAIGYHHGPDKAPVHVEFVTLLHFANRLSRIWGLGTQADPISDVDVDVINWLGADQDLLRLEESARRTFSEMLRAWQ
jgi:HD-like signal output (HDOD) protein